MSLYSMLIDRLFADDATPAERDAICTLLDVTPSAPLFQWEDDMPTAVR